MADQKTLLGWKVRERRDRSGNLVDCFVEGPPAPGMAYGLEVLGDDYTGYGDIEGKRRHCQMIVEWANAADGVREVPRG